MDPSRKNSTRARATAENAWTLHADPSARWNIASPAEPKPVPFAQTLERSMEFLATGAALWNLLIAYAGYSGRRRLARPS